MEKQTVDILIIGAGLTGLCQARTYLDLSPSTSLVILDDKDTIGGVWAKECCYPGLKTQNTYGSYEYSDFPMDEKYGYEPGRHIPALAMHEYLNDYAAHHKLNQYINLRTKVTEIRTLENKTWEVLAKCRDVAGAVTEVSFSCNKIVCSTGLSSTPNPISMPGMERFDKKIIATTELREEIPSLLKDPDVEIVTVLGGSKTTYDMVYTLASAGKKVNWCIRRSGLGPLWMMPKHIKLGPFRIRPELLTTYRFMSWFSPCIWGDADGYGFIRRLTNKTRLGRYCMHKIWEMLRRCLVKANGYREHPSLAALEPDYSIFWTGRVGILNYPTDIYDFVRSGQVKVIRSDVSHLTEEGTVHLSTPEGSSTPSTLQTDALIAITGWTFTSPITYQPPGLAAELGLPRTHPSQADIDFWSALDAKADHHIKSQFPYLIDRRPKYLPDPDTVTKHTPFRLYRALAPPILTAAGDNSIVFLKMHGSTSNAVQTELQTLWTYAYFEGHLNIAKDTVYWQTSLMSRFGRYRSPCGFGAVYPELTYDSIPYSDLLLKDLGLESKRKGGWWGEMWGIYGVKDYAGVREEFKDVLRCKAVAM